MSEEVEVSTVSGGKLLLCRCGGGYLNHSEVSVFSRREDAPTTIETRITSGGLACVAAVPSRQSRNPSSSRWHGQSILFACETCGADDFGLTVAQHKGNTFLWWRARS